MPKKQKKDSRKTVAKLKKSLAKIQGLKKQEGRLAKRFDNLKKQVERLCREQKR